MYEIKRRNLIYKPPNNLKETTKPLSSHKKKYTRTRKIGDYKNKPKNLQTKSQISKIHSRNPNIIISSKNLTKQQKKNEKT